MTIPITTAAADNYERDDAFDNVMKYLSFSIALASGIAYGVEKGVRLGVIIRRVPEDDENDEMGIISTISSILKYATIGVTTLTFFDPIFREKGKFLCFDLDKDAYVTRKNLAIILFVSVAIILIVLIAFNWDRVKDWKRQISTTRHNWRRFISILSSGGSIILGIIQLISLFTRWENHKKQKLFSISSVVYNLCAVAELYGLDKKIYEADRKAIVYGIVYGSRTAARIAQSVGILTRD